jgi:hypothetical protein
MKVGKEMDSRWNGADLNLKLEPTTGFEPATCCLRNKNGSPDSHFTRFTEPHRNTWNPTGESGIKWGKEWKNQDCPW